jgi:hypothetical protein
MSIRSIRRRGRARDSAGEQRGSVRRVGRRAFVGMAAGGGATLAELAMAATPAAAAAVSTTYVSTIGTVAQPGQLRQYIAKTAGQRVDVGGFWALGDGGGGEFYWDTSSHTGDNGGTIIVPAGSTTGRWVRLPGQYTEADARWWGVKADAATDSGNDDTAALQQAIDTTAGQSVLRLPSGISNVSATITIPSFSHIVGTGAMYAGSGVLAGSWWKWIAGPTGTPPEPTSGTVVQIGSEKATTPTQEVVLEDFGISGGANGTATKTTVTALLITSAPGPGAPALAGYTSNVRGRGLQFALTQNALWIGQDFTLGSGQDGGQADFVRFEQCQAWEFTGVGIMINSDNAVDTSLFGEWYFSGYAGSTAVQIGPNGCGYVQFDGINCGGRVTSTDFMFNIDQSSAGPIQIRNSEQEGCAFLQVTGNSDAVNVVLQGNYINPAGSSTTLPTISITGSNRVAGIGNTIQGPIALSTNSAKYVGFMDRFVHLPAGSTPPMLLQESASSEAVLVNLDTMHFDPYDFVDATSSGLINITGSPAGQTTFQPGSCHPELTGIAADVCTRSGGRCQPWPGAGKAVTATQLYMPSVDNKCQYYSLDGGTTGSSEPDWPTTYLATVTDGSVTWVNAGQAGEYRGFGPLDHYAQTGAPNSGYYRLGAVVWNTTPQPGGFVGWVCTASGNPGTWKGFGAIST